MKKQTIHIVYSLPYSLFDKITIKLLKRLLFRKASFAELPWPKPIRAPLSITYHLAEFFSQHYEVKLYDLRERIVLEPNPGDILIGHPWIDPSSVLWRALDDNRFAKKYIISPYNHNPHQVSWFRAAVEKCDKYFAICGSYWFTHFESSPFVDLAEKIVHVDMAIDSGDYPVLKKSFRPEGQRRFFYVGRFGRFGDEKGINLLERLAATIPGFSGGYICEGGDIVGWRKISEPTRLTPEFVSDLANSYDFFINMSRADAQATTVLEALSWGFPVACTRESGYMDDSLFLLDIDDLAQNVATIERMQHLQCEELERISQVNRILVETKYNWQQFARVLANNIT